MNEGWSRSESDERSAEEGEARESPIDPNAAGGSAGARRAASPEPTVLEAQQNVDERDQLAQVDEWSAIADGRPRMLAPQFVAMERVSGFITTGIIGIGAGVGVIIAGLAAGEWWIFAACSGGWLVMCALLLWWSYQYPRMFYANARYTLEDKGIEIRRGVWWRQVIDVPRSRVQHTDVTQGPLMRRYGIARLVIHTAGTENASVDLNGLDQPTALRIRDFLIQGGESDGT